MRSFAVLCIIATVAAEADSQADYTASIGHIANKTDGHIAAEVNTLESNPNDCTNVDHFTGVATTLKLGNSTPGSGDQWCNTATCVTDPTDPEGPNILDYEHDTSGTFTCGHLPFVIPEGETWTTPACTVGGVVAVKCTWEDTTPVSDQVDHMLVATDTTHTTVDEKRMVTLIKPEAKNLKGHQCAVTHGASTIGTIAETDCICVCKA